MTQHAPGPRAAAPPSPTRTSARRVALGIYFVSLGIPFLCVAALDRSSIATWLRSGTCPGGPMDRMARPCGVGEFFVSVFLGGWAAFLVVPVFVVWWLVSSIALSAALRRLQRRRLVAPPLERREAGTRG